MSTSSYSPSESPFLNQVRRTIRLKHMSRRTEKSYIYYILDYICFHKKKHPESDRYYTKIVIAKELMRSLLGSTS